ncbi:GNAT family N-acetyltransferase [Thalassospira sp.]|uniref:GNAT family N-acetyltransferase n=1 Tax=Thalassospira sp. TaxID=1912094 RepID=UPI002733ED19|nr:GNAT family N-acetyltransferase [Thalassospira sp.]MDP2699841.1 GNAT family N-acetyltransferase [Thalassospira sp.]
MTKQAIELEDFKPCHLDAAFGLSDQVNWPHRKEDWAMMQELSDGVVALQDGKVIGTAMATKFGNDAATINMVIVDQSLRGQGIGRVLMNAALDRTRSRECRLVATAEGLPLYQKLGFVVTGDIVQLQGIAQAAEKPDNIDRASRADLDAIRDMDRAACGMDRHRLIDLLFARADIAVLRRDGGIAGYAALRPFGRGDVVGPIVAADLADAIALASFMFHQRAGAFVRVDTPIQSGMVSWLEQHGLGKAGGGVVMIKDAIDIEKNMDVQVFALASQALG